MTVATEKEIKAMVALIKSKGWKVFERPYELNIVGVRLDQTLSNKFQDKIYVFYKDDKGNWMGKIYPATTDPGTYWINKPMTNMGAAIVMEGQYINAYQVGLHLGQYEALVQRGNLTVLRDYNRANVIDINNGVKETGSSFGINIHHAGSSGTTADVGMWSAGCQVFADITDFADFMVMVKKHQGLYGNNFTYTLIDQRAFMRMIKRRSIYTALAIGVIVVGIWYYRKKILKAADIQLVD